MLRNENIGNLPEGVERLLESYRMPEGKTRFEVWDSIFDRLERGKQTSVAKVRTIPTVLARVAVAASIFAIALLSSYIYLYRKGNVIVQLARGEHGVVYLPDSSRIQLNADSRVSFNKNRWFIDRSVTLTGEALFEVTKGNRFRVLTPFATTTVLGTVFNIYSRGDVVKVTCFEGKVKVVATNSKAQTLLTKGMEARTMGYVLDVKMAETAELAAKPTWANNEFFFNNTPLGYVIEELERQFDVDIFLEVDSSKLYSGYFKRNSIDEALNLVCIPLGLKWSYNGEIIVITNM